MEVDGAREAALDQYRKTALQHKRLEAQLKRDREKVSSPLLLNFLLPVARHFTTLLPPNYSPMVPILSKRVPSLMQNMRKQKKI